MSREVAEGDLDKQPVEKSEGERSGVSLNSSFVTISTANSSSSQGRGQLPLSFTLGIGYAGLQIGV